MARTGVSEKLSIGFDGSPADGPSGAPDLSADGRWVAFVSEASNLVEDDTNGVSDVFLLDRQTKALERVSVAADGTEADGASGELAGGLHYSRDSIGEPPAISDNGRYVAFGSAAGILVDGDENGLRDIFLVDRITDNVTRVSSSTSGETENGVSFVPAISGNGRFVAFISEADNLVGGDTNGEADLFLFDRVSQSLARVSEGARGLGLDRVDIEAGPPAISGNGRFIAYGFGAEQLGELPPEDSDDLTAPDEPNVEVGVFVYDSRTGKTEFLGRETTYTQEAFDDPPLTEPTISADGQTIAFVNGHVFGTRAMTFGLYRDLTVIDRGSGEEISTIAGSSARLFPHSIYSPSLSGDGGLVAYGYDNSAFGPDEWAVVHHVESAVDLVRIYSGWTQVESVDLAELGRAMAFGAISDVTTGATVTELYLRELPHFVVGTDARDKLNGSKGDDDMFGLAGDDTLSGNAGEDRLDGGAGADLVAGGKGEDVFIFDRDGGKDTIKDFAAGDLLDLSAWIGSTASLPDSWLDGLQAGDLGVSAGKKAMVIDLGGTTGSAADIHVVTIAGTFELSLVALIVEDSGGF